MKRLVLLTALVLVAAVVLCNVWIVKSTENKVYTDINNIPVYNVGLVLGTSHKVVGGAPNPYFHKRIETAAALYKLGKIQHFILSGDNRTIFYNEPWEMRKALIKEGVPDSVITLDYAGLRTLDSIVRSKEIFGQNKITIITQPFHSYRALFISNYYDIDAIAMVADEPGLEQSFKVLIREYFARAKAVLDLYVFKTEPRHLGRKEQINITM
ncbi:YdcF family protein [Fulvivirgaceae bacterium PWU20]|uniref:YdcF family protein n=1 Tax=Chryseosolibacter indicus TaxID=2782351 RepID=A0ABS5VRN1_9BACT|nr:YdcF family protein [Chryseosolibacter indicus]